MVRLAAAILLACPERQLGAAALRLVRAPQTVRLAFQSVVKAAAVVTLRAARAAAVRFPAAVGAAVAVL